MKTSSKFVIALLGSCSLAGFAFGQASILTPGGAVALGVNRTGELNVGDRYNLNPRGGSLGVSATALGDATSPGCLCEGWGVSAKVGVSSYSGWANRASGGANLVVDSFLTDDVGAAPGTYAESNVHLSTLPSLTVKQHYAASTGAPTLLFENVVTITNTSGAAMDDVRYVRVMDWDIPPTEFSEYVTIIGTATTAALELSHDDGFETSNPLAATSAIMAGTTDVDFIDFGARDHGAYFKFNFGTLAAGDSLTFSVFYGATSNQATALAALGAIGAELYSLGQRSPLALADTSTTFIFAFKGVGGVRLVPDSGSSLLLIGMGLAALGALRRRIAA